MHKLFTSLFILSLVSCIGKGGNNNLNSEYIDRHCITDRFAQGQDDNLYGLECLEGKKLVIETSHMGQLVSTTSVTDSEKGLDLEGNLDFQNKFYNTTYDIKENKGSAKDTPWLLKFLHSDEEFTGNLNAKYHIIFKTWGNYLVLFKASHHLKDLPYTERTSLKVFRNGDLKDYDSSDEQTGDYYMVPFIGYPIQYCKAETQLNAKGEKTVESRASCKDSYLQTAKYIKVDPTSNKPYNFLNKKEDSPKKNLFPAKYFEGSWYYSSGSVEAPSDIGELAPFDALLVKMEKGQNGFHIKDISGDVEDKNKLNLDTIPVNWLDFETNTIGNNQFKEFGEKKRTEDDSINRAYVQIKPMKMLSENKILKLTDLVKLTITPDYLSFVHKAIVHDPKDPNDPNDKKNPLHGKTVKWKTSFLRTKSVDTAGFVPRKWFQYDHDHIFGSLNSEPQWEAERAGLTESALKKHRRMIKFNTSLNTEKEKETKTKTIKWYFSNNSTKDPEYRAVAQKAIEIYNQAFEYLNKNSDKKIQLELVTNKEPDLGDLRYNIINLVKPEKNTAGDGGILGVAPSYVNSNTGQIIGTTSNILVHNLESGFDSFVRSYIRYEIFQKDKRTEKENNIHVISPFLRKQIQRECPEVDDFISFVKNNQTQLRPRTELSDKETILSCGEKLTVHALLDLVLHEMGHSFGLGHNFKASTDKANYYQSEEEIKNIFPHIDSIGEIASLSSVMDYNKPSHPGMKYLGKYDLAALKYLYLDKLELKDGTLFDLNIDPNPDNQTALTDHLKRNRKIYKHCSDNLQVKDLMCYPHDYGSTPKEIAEDDIMDFKRILNIVRYRYDLDEMIFQQNLPNLARSAWVVLRKPLILYSNWLELKNNYLESISQLDSTNYIFNDETSISKYKELINKGKSNKEYALYYPMRDIMPNFIMELMSLEEMSCHVIDSEGKEHKLNLENIKNRIKYRYGDKLYVEDCHSSQILSFFKTNNLTFLKQSGYENFGSYYSRTSPENKWDISPIVSLFTPGILEDKKNKVDYSLITTGIGKGFINPPYLIWQEEPDLLKSLNEKVQKNLLDTEKNKSQLESDKNMFLVSSFLFGIEKTLNQANKKAILAEHMDNIKFLKYTKGTGPYSFYKNVTEPLSKGFSIENIENPFLIDAYNQYLKKQAQGNTTKNLSVKDAEAQQENFFSYLLKRKDVFNNTEEQIITIPVKMNSFSSKLIKKYKENLNQIEELENRTDLSVIEELLKENLKQHNITLREIF